MKRRLITVSLLSAACALLLPASGAHAQGTTGSITGTITGAESNQPIQGVRVTLLGTLASLRSVGEVRGLGSMLAKAALDAVAAEEGTRVVAQCPFIAAYIERHPQYQPLLTR